MRPDVVEDPATTLLALCGGLKEPRGDNASRQGHKGRETTAINEVVWLSFQKHPSARPLLCGIKNHSPFILYHYLPFFIAHYHLLGTAFALIYDIDAL